MGIIEEYQNGLQLGLLKTVQPIRFSKFMKL